MGQLGRATPEQFDGHRERVRTVRRVLCPVLLVVLLGLAASAGAGGVAGAAVAGDAAGNETAGNGTAANETAPGALTVVDVGNVSARADSTTYLWPDEDQAVEARLETPVGLGFEQYSVCLAVEREAASDRSCHRVSPGAGTVRIPWAGDQSGPGTLTVTLAGGPESDARLLARENVTVHVMSPSGDVDNDKLSNQRERALGTNLTDTDTDDDGLMDGVEVTEYGTDPLSADTDKDGVRDAVEIQQGTDPLERDTDGDGAPDKVELERGTDPTLPDSDWDGVDDGRELEVGTDPTTADTDGDGLSDGLELELDTDPTTADTDGDGLSDGLERQLGTDPTDAANPALGVAGVLVALAGAAWWFWRRRGPATTPDEPDHDAGAAAETADDDAADDDGPLTDRDRIRQLLRESDGRLKQARIVERTNWSKAKVSRVLSGMEEDDEISKIRIGRENLICLKGQEPDLAQPSV